jgi:hypothetical protein
VIFTFIYSLFTRLAGVAIALLHVGFQVKRNEILEDGEMKYEFESIWRHSEVPTKLILKSIILAVDSSANVVSIPSPTSASTPLASKQVQKEKVNPQNTGNVKPPLTSTTNLQQSSSPKTPISKKTEIQSSTPHSQAETPSSDDIFKQLEDELSNLQF